MANAGYATIPAVLGLSHDYRNLSNWLKENLVPSKEKKFRESENKCMLGSWFVGEKDIGSYFKRGLNSLLNDDVPWDVVRDSGIMGLRGTPKSPWYLYSVMLRWSLQC